MIRRLLEATLIPSNRADAFAARLETLAALFRRTAVENRNLVASEAALRRELEQYREANRQRAVDEARKLSCGHTRAAKWLLPDGPGRHFWGCVQCEYDRRGAALAYAREALLRCETPPDLLARVDDALKGRYVE